MQKKATSLTAKQRDKLAQVVLTSFGKNPDVIRKDLPEVARELESLNHTSRKTEYGMLFQLTPLERARLGESLSATLGKLRKRDEVSRDEAIAALENVATLVSAFPLESLEATKDELFKLVKSATGIVLGPKVKRESVVLGQGQPARDVYLLRGVNLRLTWDRKLLALESDPKELVLRSKALSIIGMGAQEAKCVGDKLKGADGRPPVRNSVLIDSSAIDAILSPSSAYHSQAALFYETLVNANIPIGVTSYSLLDICSSVHRGQGIAKLRGLMNAIGPILGVYWVDEATHNEALQMTLSKPGASLSLLDWTVVIVAKKLSGRVFTFNGNLEAEGVIVFPRSKQACTNPASTFAI